MRRQTEDLNHAQFSAELKRVLHVIHLQNEIIFRSTIFIDRVMDNNGKWFVFIQKSFAHQEHSSL